VGSLSSKIRATRASRLMFPDDRAARWHRQPATAIRVRHIERDVDNPPVGA
jgi:hypothetical protein